MHVRETRSELLAQLVLKSGYRRTPSRTQRHHQQSIVRPAVEFEDRIDWVRRRGADVSQSCLDELSTHILLYDVSDLADDLLRAFDPRAGGGTNLRGGLGPLHRREKLGPR